MPRGVGYGEFEGLARGMVRSGGGLATPRPSIDGGNYGGYGRAPGNITEVARELSNRFRRRQGTAPLANGAGGTGDTGGATPNIERPRQSFADPSASGTSLLNPRADEFSRSPGGREVVDKLRSQRTATAGVSGRLGGNVAPGFGAGAGLPGAGTQAVPERRVADLNVDELSKLSQLLGQVGQQGLVQQVQQMIVGNPTGEFGNIYLADLEQLFNPQQ